MNDKWGGGGREEYCLVVAVQCIQLPVFGWILCYIILIIIVIVIIITTATIMIIIIIVMKQFWLKSVICSHKPSLRSDADKLLKCLTS